MDTVRVRSGAKALGSSTVFHVITFVLASIGTKKEDTSSKVACAGVDYSQKGCQQLWLKIIQVKYERCDSTCSDISCNDILDG